MSFYHDSIMFWWNASSSLLPWYPMLFFLEHFNRALTIMNQAVSGTLQPGAKENVAYLTNTERRYSFFGFVLLSGCCIDWFVVGKWLINSFRYRDSCIFQSIFEIITISFAANSIMSLSYLHVLLSTPKSGVFSIYQYTQHTFKIKYIITRHRKWILSGKKKIFLKKYFDEV